MYRRQKCSIEYATPRLASYVGSRPCVRILQPARPSCARTTVYVVKHLLEWWKNVPYSEDCQICVAVDMDMEPVS